VAGVEGLEPPAIGFGDRCSTNWNYTPVARRIIRRRMKKERIL
jgi:hypothetical protein